MEEMQSLAMFVRRLRQIPTGRKLLKLARRENVNFRAYDPSTSGLSLDEASVLYAHSLVNRLQFNRRYESGAPMTLVGNHFRHKAEILARSAIQAIPDNAQFTAAEKVQLKCAHIRDEVGWWRREALMADFKLTIQNELKAIPIIDGAVATKPTKPSGPVKTNRELRLI